MNRLIESIGALKDVDQSIAIDLRYLESVAELDNKDIAALELSLVGTGVQGGFSNTSKLK